MSDSLWGRAWGPESGQRVTWPLRESVFAYIFFPFPTLLTHARVGVTRGKRSKRLRVRHAKYEGAPNPPPVPALLTHVLCEESICSVVAYYGADYCPVPLSFFVFFLFFPLFFSTMHFSRWLAANNTTLPGSCLPGSPCRVKRQRSCTFGEAGVWGRCAVPPFPRAHIQYHVSGFCTER